MPHVQHVKMDTTVQEVQIEQHVQLEQKELEQEKQHKPTDALLVQ